MQLLNNIDNTGLLKGACYFASMHCDDRPVASDIDLLVIHCISLPPEQYGHNYVEDFFLGRLDTAAHPYFQQLVDVRVSAHLYIRRDGRIVQFVPFTKRAWHAGLSQFDGRVKCNDFSIGIELEGDVHSPYTGIQYERLADVTRQIQRCYPAIIRDRITGHSDIAPDRKDDPGPFFDWPYYFNLLDRV